jgi:hypothetical protein
MLKKLAFVPDYRITIHMKVGNNKTGVRWHPSYDVNHVKSLVEVKVRKLLGTAVVKWIDVEIVARSTGNRMETKNLNLQCSVVEVLVSQCRGFYISKGLN